MFKQVVSAVSQKIHPRGPMTYAPFPEEGGMDEESGAVAPGLLSVNDDAMSIADSTSNIYANPERRSIAASFFKLRSVMPFAVGGAIAGGVFGPVAINLCQTIAANNSI